MGEVAIERGFIERGGTANFSDDKQFVGASLLAKKSVNLSNFQRLNAFFVSKLTPT